MKYYYLYGTVIDERTPELENYYNEKYITKECYNFLIKTLIYQGIPKYLIRGYLNFDEGPKFNRNG